MRGFIRALYVSLAMAVGLSSTPAGSMDNSATSSVPDTPPKVDPSGPPHVALDYYPNAARRLNEQGTVVVDFTITTAGTVADPRVTRSSGFADLDNAAVEAAKTWRYLPATHDGQPVAKPWRVEVKFALQDLPSGGSQGGQANSILAPDMGPSLLLQQEEGLSTFNKVLALADPSSAPGLFDANAETLLSTGDFNGAIAAYTAAIKLNPNRADLLARRAFVYAVKGELDKADADFAEGLKLDPRSTAALLARASVELARDENDKASADFDSIHAANPKSATGHWAAAIVASIARDLSTAYAEASEAISADPKFWPAYEIRAIISTQRENMSDAFANFDAMARFAPDVPDGFMGRCSYYAGIRDRARAMADCDKAVALAPGIPAVHAVRAYALSRLGENSGALAEANTAIALRGGTAELYFIRAEIESAGNQLDAQLADLNRAISLNVRNPRLYAYRCDALYRKNELDQALADCNQALTLQPGLYDGLVGRALIESAKGEFEPAINDLQTAIGLNSKKSNAYGDLGKVYADHGDLDKAQINLDIAVTLEPGDGDLRMSRAGVDLFEKNFAKTLADATAAARLGDDWALTSALEGYGAFGLGDFQHAVAAFRQRLARDPTSIYAMLWLYLSESRAGIPPERELADALRSSAAGTAWPSPITQMMTGQSAPSALLAQVENDNPGHKCEAGFFAGELLLMSHDTHGAKTAFQLSQASCQHASPDAAIGQAELSRL